MTFDVHQLDPFLLVGAGVTLLAILAVRVVVARRPAQPAALPADGRRARRERRRDPRSRTPSSRTRSGFAALALILAEGGLTTRWREVRPSMRLGLSLATIGVAVSVTSWRVGRPLPARAALGARRAARRGDLADRRGGGVLGAARAAAAAAARRRARGRVGTQRRPDRRPGHADLHRRRGRPRHRRARSAIVVFELVVGLSVRPGRRLRRRLADAPGGAAVARASTRSP